jgi:methylmalonyl-CoA/ethylmalonyl-CoA epimerase
MLGDPMQVCFVVPDLEEAMKAWADTYGVGPFSIWNFDELPVVDPGVAEGPTTVPMRIALAMWGPLELELIQPVDEKSIWATSLAAHGGKAHVHHLRAGTADYDAALERYGEPLMSGGLGTHRFAYLDTQADVGTILEINHYEGEDMLENAPAPHAVYP